MMVSAILKFVCSDCGNELALSDSGEPEGDL